jgi:hypothetical protein
VILSILAGTDGFWTYGTGLTAAGAAVCADRRMAWRHILARARGCRSFGNVPCGAEFDRLEQHPIKWNHLIG